MEISLKARTHWRRSRRRFFAARAVDKSTTTLSTSTLTPVWTSHYGTHCPTTFYRVIMFILKASSNYQVVHANHNVALPARLRPRNKRRYRNDTTTASTNYFFAH